MAFKEGDRVRIIVQASPLAGETLYKSATVVGVPPIYDRHGMHSIIIDGDDVRRFFRETSLELIDDFDAGGLHQWLTLR